LLEHGDQQRAMLTALAPSIPSVSIQGQQMKTLPKILTALICILAAEPALAVSVTDGTGRGIAAADLAKILSIMSPLGGDLTGLHQAAGRGNERYYCGRVQTA
jgi:hypothetical protein